MLNAFASTAVQAIGQVWSEVWRQLVSILLLVVTVAAFSRWGIEGAAFGVLVTTLTQSVLMYGLLGTTSGLTPRDVWAPQVPSLLCAAGAATIAVVTGQALRLIEPAPRPWVLLAGADVSRDGIFRGFRSLLPVLPMCGRSCERL